MCVCFMFFYGHCFFEPGRSQRKKLIRKEHHTLICACVCFFLCFMNVSWFKTCHKHFLEAMTSKPIFANCPRRWFSFCTVFKVEWLVQTYQSFEITKFWINWGGEPLTLMNLSALMCQESSFMDEDELEALEWFATATHFAVAAPCTRVVFFMEQWIPMTVGPLMLDASALREPLLRWVTNYFCHTGRGWRWSTRKPGQATSLACKEKISRLMFLNSAQGSWIGLILRWWQCAVKQGSAAVLCLASIVGIVNLVSGCRTTGSEKENSGEELRLSTSTRAKLGAT